MPPAEGEAATPAVEARAEVPEVPVEGEGKATEAAIPTETTAEETSTAKTEVTGKESDIQPIIETPKESETKEAGSKPDVVKEGEVKAGETATSAANLDNAANLAENVDKQETNATNDDKPAEESASKEAAEPASSEPKLDLKDEPVNEESKKENEGDKGTEE